MRTPRNSNMEHAPGPGAIHHGNALRRWLGRSGAPIDHRPIADLQQLLTEVGKLCRHAAELPLEEPEKIALQRLYGEVTADAQVAFAFQGTLSRTIRNWLRRAGLVVTAAKTNTAVAGDATATDLLDQLRHIVDVGNVAILRRSQSARTWAEFRSAVDRSTPHRSLRQPDH